MSRHASEIEDTLYAGCEHFTLVVDPGKRYRLRLANFASLMMFSFAIEGHTLEIIAADATPTDPIAVDHVDINSGECAFSSNSLGFSFPPAFF